MIRYIRPVRSGAARGLVKEVYRQIGRELGILGEPLTLHSPLPDLLAALWSSFRESVVADGAARAMKEAVAVSVARLNDCLYCADAHTVFLRATRAHEAAELIRSGRERRIADPQLRAAAEWGSATLTPGVGILANPPFSPSEAPQFVGTAVWMHYINRMSTIFLQTSLIPLKANPVGLRSIVERLGGWFFAGTISRARVPGISLCLLPDRELPEDLSWASSSPPIARAYAAFASAAENAGAQSVPLDARACVRERVAAWSGEDPGLSRSWLDAAVSRLNRSSRPVAQLALLAALAPHRIVKGQVHDFQARFPEDERLLGAVAWASFTAARRIGTWIGASGQ